jgi:hypothetical protein
MITLKQISKKYRIDIQKLDNCYYDALLQTKKVHHSLNEELLKKFLEDKLEELQIPYVDITKIIEIYMKDTTLQKNIKNEKFLNKIIYSTKSPIEIVEEEIKKMDASTDTSSIQTSNNTGIDTAIGRNKKPPYTFKHVDLYTKGMEREEPVEDQNEDKPLYNIDIYS